MRYVMIIIEELYSDVIRFIYEILDNRDVSAEIEQQRNIAYTSSQAKLCYPEEKVNFIISTLVGGRSVELTFLVWQKYSRSEFLKNRVFIPKSPSPTLHSEIVTMRKHHRLYLFHPFIQL